MKKYGKRTLIVLLFIVILSLGVVLFNEIFSSKAKAQESSLEDIRIELIMSEEEDAVIGILSFNKDNEPIAIDIPEIYIWPHTSISIEVQEEGESIILTEEDTGTELYIKLDGSNMPLLEEYIETEEEDILVNL